MALTWYRKDKNYPNNRKIKLIRKMERGYEILFLWECILSEGMNDDRLGVIEPIGDLNKYLSNIYDFDLDLVKLGIDAFILFGMVKYETSIGLIILNYSKHQSLDKIERKRVLNKLRQAKYYATTTGKDTERIEIEIEEVKSNSYYKPNTSNTSSNVSITESNVPDKDKTRQRQDKTKEDNTKQEQSLNFYFNKWLIDNRNTTANELDINDPQRTFMFTDFIKSDYYKNKVPKGLKK